MFVLCAFWLLQCIYQVHGFSINSHIKISPLRSRLSLASSGQDYELDVLRLDISKLSPAETERLARIRKLTDEADDLARAAGFNVREGEEPDVLEKEVIDTDWSGQSEMDVVTSSSRSWSDVVQRPGLALGDAAALFIFAAIGRNNHGEGHVTSFSSLHFWRMCSMCI
jgi:hypothetical protein